MPAEEALPLALELANALDAVHQVGLVHGDVKPHNVFLCGQLDNPAHVKLIDFGFAQIARQESLVGEATVAGTLEYMAPEQILSDPIDPRADIYSLGVVLFRWVTAELPFDTSAMLRIFAHHLESKAPPPSWLLEDMHPGLEKLILACMRKNPDNRYSCMADVITDLLCIILDLGAVSGAPILVEPDEYWPRSDQGRHALEILSSLGASKRASTPIPDEKSLPMSSGVRTSGDKGPDSGVPPSNVVIVEKVAG
jgi:serine/threonine-protein kinase